MTPTARSNPSTLCRPARPARLATIAPTTSNAAPNASSGVQISQMSPSKLRAKNQAVSHPAAGSSRARAARRRRARARPASCAACAARTASRDVAGRAAPRRLRSRSGRRWLLRRRRALDDGRDRHGRRGAVSGRLPAERACRGLRDAPAVVVGERPRARAARPRRARRPRRASRCASSSTAPARTFANGDSMRGPQLDRERDRLGLAERAARDVEVAVDVERPLARRLVRRRLAHPVVDVVVELVDRDPAVAVAVGLPALEALARSPR